MALAADEDVLPIGCGPGFEPAELAPAVGDDGRVLGIDRIPAMLALAATRCADHPQVGLARGDAAALPLPEDGVDAAVAVQVYEYLDDVDAEAAELARVLAAFDDHCPHPRLGSRLAPILRDAGLTVERVVPNTFCNTRSEEGWFVHHLAAFIEEYAADHEAIGPEEAARGPPTDANRRQATGRSSVSRSIAISSGTRPEPSSAPLPRSGVVVDVGEIWIRDVGHTREPAALYLLLEMDPVGALDDLVNLRDLGSVAEFGGHMRHNLLTYVLRT